MKSKNTYKNKKENNVKQNNIKDILLVLPFILIVLLVPVIVRLKPVILSGARELFKIDQPIDVDIFTYYKMYWFVGLTLVGVLIYFYKKSINELRFQKRKIYIPMLTYLALVISSTLFSAYRDVAIIGFMARYENIFVLASYMIVMFLAINLMQDKKQIKILFYALGISATIVSFIAIAQYLGKNFFTTEFAKNIILGKKYLYLSEEMILSGEIAHSTLGNTNYVGVFTSMLFPLFSILTIQSKKWFDKLYFAIVSLLLITALFASNSRAGLIAVGIYLVLAFSLYAKKIFTSPVGVVSIVLLIAIVFGFNKYSENKLYNRVLSVKDSLVTKTEVDFKDIILEGSTANIIIGDRQLKIVYDHGSIDFYDGDDNELKTHRENFNIIIRGNEGYPEHFFEVGNYEDNLVMKSSIVSNYGRMNFNLVIDEDDNFRFMNTKGEVIDLKEVPKWGFAGKERSVSNRGYIWSRSIPLLKDNIIIGKGPDTFALYFPQEDYVGKLIGFGRTNVLVDKPHNLYLQMGINTGILSMLAIISIFIMYMYDSIKILFIKGRKIEDEYKIFGKGIFFTFISFLITSLTNDSTLYVSPIFWTLLGIGVNSNFKVKEIIEDKK